MKERVVVDERRELGEREGKLGERKREREKGKLHLNLSFSFLIAAICLRDIGDYRKEKETSK